MTHCKAEIMIIGSKKAIYSHPRKFSNAHEEPAPESVGSSLSFRPVDVAVEGQAKQEGNRSQEQAYIGEKIENIAAL